MKNTNTCINCAILECHIRLDCEDNELPSENREQKAKNEDENVTFQVEVPTLTEKVIAEKRF